MRSSRSSILLCILLMGARSEARPQESPSDSDLTRLTPEQLLEFDVVHAASRYRQVRREAPSAITVVTAAEIRSHRYRTLGDVLKSLPSFYVTYDRNYSYIGVRGFSRPGDYNTRVLVLMDGVRLNENVYDGVYLTDGFPLDLAIVDRIEIVRGPAASVYGNGAFFAVIDVITKRGVDLGREVEASAASFGTFSGRASYGRAFGNGLDVAASASGLDSQGQDLAFPELASSETDGLARGLDGEKRRTYFAGDDLPRPAPLREPRASREGRTDRRVRHVVRRAGHANDRRHDVARVVLRDAAEHGHRRGDAASARPL